jgi:hypothetical protein
VADDVMRRAASETHTPPVVSTLPARPESRADRARRLVYRGRFAVLYLLLAIVAGAAVGTLVVLVGRGTPAPAEAWSEWQPTGSGERRATQIGEQVSDGYGLTTVTYAGPPTITGPDGTTFQVRAIAISSDTRAGGVSADDIETVDASRTVMYTLCGLGQGCSIPTGKASPERDALIRREALELALYSFKYVDGVESTLVLVPPAQPAAQTTTAVFLEESNLEAALSRPLDETLTAPLTPGEGEITGDELRTIDRLTKSRVYTAALIQAQDQSPVMVLTPALRG